MRLFIAINLSNDMKAALFDLQNDLYDRGVSGRYTTEENLQTLCWKCNRSKGAKTL